jgi:hypothetical protein
VLISHAQLGRIERGEINDLTVEQLSRACAAVGLRLVIRAVPGGDPALDRGQLALLNRLRRVLPRDLPFRTEVPLPIPGDRRAWDAVASLDRRVAFEAEARLRDIQVVDRRSALKFRDGDVDVMVLVVAETGHNRGVLALHREALRSTFPLDGRHVLSALRAGRAPEANGIVVL